MGRNTIANQHQRSLGRNNTGTYLISLPIDLVQELGWRERQKLVVKRRGKQLIIEDWPAKGQL